MFWLFSRRHPLDNVHSKFHGLVGPVKKLQQNGDRFGSDPRVMALLEKLVLSPKHLYRSIREELDLWGVYGTISQEGTRHIRVAFHDLMTNLGNLDQRLAKAGRYRDRKSLKEVNRAAQPLGQAIVRLAKAVASGSVPVVRSYGSFPEAFMKVREAMSAVDQITAEKLTGPEVDSWRRWPGFNDENPREVRRIAKLIWLAKLPEQEFRFMVQSDALGKPLKFLKRLDGFPSERDLEIFSHSLGRGPGKIYVVVTQPSWRRIWVFTPDNSVWCDCRDCLLQFYRR